MKFHRSWLLLVFLVAPASAFAQVNDTYVIPAAANTSGANGSRWATEFHIFNPQSYPLRVTLTLIRTGGTPGSTIDFTIGANSTAYSENILADVFSTSGSGSLLIATFPEKNPTVPDRVIARSFLVNSKTYNIAANGTFGQSIDGIFYGLQDFDSDKITGIANGIRNTSIFSGFRTNIGAVNLGRYSVTMYVTVYDTDGRAIRRDIPFVIPPMAHFQDSLPVAVNHGAVEFLVDDPRQDAVVFPYASVIDNRTNDPIYVTPVLLATPSVLYSQSEREPKKITLEHARKIVEGTESLPEVSVQADGRLGGASSER